MKAQEKAAPVISLITLSKCYSSQYGAIWVYPSERFGSLCDNGLCSSLSPWHADELGRNTLPTEHSTSLLAVIISSLVYP